MTISLPLATRLLIVVGCVLATQVPAWQLERRTSADAAIAQKFDVTRLPMQLGPWTGVDVDIDERLVRHIGATSFVNRSYENGQGRMVTAHLAVFRTAEISLPHPPGRCYGGAGWTIGPDRENRDKGGAPIRTMTVEREGSRAVITYWYQLGSDLAASRGELRQRLQKLRWKGERWPPLVKVLIHVPFEGSDEVADSDAIELGTAIYDWIKAES